MRPRCAPAQAPTSASFVCELLCAWQVKIIKVDKVLDGRSKESFQYTYDCVWKDGSPDKTCRAQKDEFVKRILNGMVVGLRS